MRWRRRRSTGGFAVTAETAFQRFRAGLLPSMSYFLIDVAKVGMPDGRTQTTP